MGQIPLRGFYLQTTFHPPKKNIPPSACQSRRGADRAVLAQPHVDDPEDTYLQEHVQKPCMERDPFIKANSTITVPQVEEKKVETCACQR